MINLRPDLTLRQLLVARLTGIKQQLTLLRKAIDRMSDKPISSYEFDQLKVQVAGLAEATHELETRVKLLEQHASTANWAVRQVGVVTFIVFLVWLMGVLR